MIHKSLRHLRSRYGITPDAYVKLYNEQKGVCIGCGQPPKGGGRSNSNNRLFVDHNHATGNIRGLLCQGCNAALGLAKDSPEVLRNLAAYLEKEPILLVKDFPVKDRGSKERSKTHCPKSHPYDAINTRYNNLGYRVCRACTKAADKIRYQKKLRSRVTELT